MNKDEAQNCLQKCAEELKKREPNLWDFSDQTAQTEWNLAHHLACILAGKFGDLDVDVDVAKTKFNYKRPDIIIHERGDSNSNNLLVIECKRGGKDTTSDTAKILEYWFSKDLAYKYGAIVVFEDNGTAVIKKFLVNNSGVDVEKENDRR